MPASVADLTERVTSLVRSDLPAAEALAYEALEMAAASGLPASLGLARRALGIVHWSANRYEEALDSFTRSLEHFNVAGEELEAARTQSNALQTLIYLSRFSLAMHWAAEARAVFTAHNQPLRLARLDGNIANLLYRQDRFEEAIALYDSVEARFRELGEARDVAAVLRNKAVCLLGLTRFEEALATHESARVFCVENGMPNLVAECDYNIAYLYFSRGDYLKARSLYETARRQAVGCGDKYHAALCDLDQAEMYIELNLGAGGERLARRARQAFRTLGLGYEAAKAEVFVGLCAGRQGDLRRALAMLFKARKHFVADGNAVWPALIDLYAALLLDRGGFARKARQRCRRALGFFSPTVLPAKAVQCRLLLARIELATSGLPAARGHVQAARRLLPQAQSPALAGHTWHVAGQIEELFGNPDAASRLYSQAEDAFEALRDRLGAEDLRISFFEDKTAAYESHFSLLLRQHDTAQAFQTAERAKSRNLITAANPRPQPHSELTALKRQLHATEISPTPASSRAAESLRTQIQIAQSRYTEAYPPAIPPTLAETQAALPSDATLIEYFRAEDRYFAFTLANGHGKVHRLGSHSRILSLARYVNFQLARVRQTPMEGAMRDTAIADLLMHLQALYAELLAPLEPYLGGGHCIIVPHGILHGLPFHALHDGRRYFSDRYTVSTAPSAAILLQSLAPRAFPTEPRSLVFGVADAAAPSIRDEARVVAALAPSATLFLDEDATLSRLRLLGASARHIHLAAHAHFRRDNPWFSSIRLGDANLSLYDLYEMELPAELVVLSGCGTGMSVVLGGDELVGLVRGLLLAGARSALVSLWDVNDQSSTHFMASFYRRLNRDPHLARAVQAAQMETREIFPHPFHWAPFSLVGHFAGIGWQKK
jgi:tetratricopeptide (TPR) repeat protein